MTYITRSRFLLGILGMAALFGAVLPNAIQAQSNPASQKIESDDEQVAQTGTWLAQSVDAASGGGYLYNSGEATLSLNFSGASLEVIYVSGPSLGTLAIEVDGTVLRTVITTAENTAYGQAAKIDYLTDEPHELKVYAQGGAVIAVDAFVLTSLETPPAPLQPVVYHDDGGIQGGACFPRTLVDEPIPWGLFLAISGDGRYVGFVNLSQTVTFGIDVWLYDRQTCAVSLVATVSTGHGTQPNIASLRMSDDAQYMVLRLSSNGFPAFNIDVYWITVSTGNATLIPGATGTAQNFVPVNGDVSGDGRWLAYVAAAGGLFLRDQSNGNVTPITAPGGIPIVPTSNLTISEDGRFVAFGAHNSDLVAGDTNGVPDAFVYDHVTTVVSRVSVGAGGVQANDESGATDISGDGRFVLFSSNADNLAGPTPPGHPAIFLFDRLTSTIERISVNNSGAPANNFNGGSQISGDGRYVVFASSATNLDPGNRPALNDIFMRDRLTQRTTLMSWHASAVPNNAGGFAPVISRDGSTIAYNSYVTDLVPPSHRVIVRSIRDDLDRLAIFRPDTNAVGLFGNLVDLPPTYTYLTTTLNPPMTGQWVMGDWDGDGDKTPGVYGANGVFYYANETNATATWSPVWVGLLGRPPVAGRFNAAVNHDCIGAVDSANFPPHGTAFALYFTCDLPPDTAPPLTFQWLSVILPDAGGFSGTHQVAAGDFNNDGADSIAVRRGEFIAFGNVPPTTLLSEFNLAQYWGVPPVTGGDYGVFLAGNFDNGAGDSFGVFYQNGNFYYRNATDWNPGGYELQRVGQLIGTPVQATAWH